MTVYYNEHDKFAAEWLRNLIAAGHIAPGDVDERSIVDVRPADLRGYGQCHFFAGIGVWSYALRHAGWHDDRECWTGSCPCQPFSAAGKGSGFADERHLWPAFFHLIEQCEPRVVFGEQVASKDGLAWLDLVCADLEAAGYAIGAVDTCAAGFGAPHIRQRLYWVADADAAGLSVVGRAGLSADSHASRGHDSDGCGEARGLGDAERAGLEGYAGHGDYPRGRSFALGSVAASGAVGGFWRDAHVVYCRDEKLRPVEPGTFPLVAGAPARVGRLRGYGNAINAEVARHFIEAYCEVTA